MAKRIVEKDSFASPAVVTILSRDAFGYTAAGIVFLLVMQAWFDIAAKVTGGATPNLPGEIFLLVGALSAAYPLGRLFFVIGRWVGARGRREWADLYPAAFRTLSKSIPLHRIRPWGITPTEANARTLFGRLLDRWVFVKRPGLFYVSVTRQNTLRILTETTLGLVICLGVVLLVAGAPVRAMEVVEGGRAIWPEMTEVEWRLWIAGVAVVLGVINFLYIGRAKRAQARAEIQAGFLVVAETPPDVAEQPPPEHEQPSIVVLGWGSLLWNQGSLPLSTTWTLDGPALPIEFSRISSNGRLTLVLDRENGVAVRSWTAGLSCETLEDAIAALQEREGCPRHWIGWVDLETGTHSEDDRHEDVWWTVMDWARRQGVGRVVWTALPADFESKTEQDFSVAAALNYLENLDGTRRARALEYVRRAPYSTWTPVREAFDKHFGD